MSAESAPLELPKLSLLSDVVFRKLFDEPEFLISLLNALLHLRGERRIVSLTITTPSFSGPLADDKEAILDIRAKCHNGRHFHIELQVRAFVAYAERMLYYWSGPYHGQLQVGQGYRDLKPLISIHILGFHLLPQRRRYRHFHHLFEVRERRTHYRLSKHLQIHTIELPKLTAAANGDSTDERKWLSFLRRADEMSPDEVAGLDLPELVRAEEKLRVISQDRELRVLYEQRMKAQRDAIAWEKDHISQWLEDGERVGLEKGKKLGLDEGKKLGLQAAIMDLCELLGIEATTERRAWLAGLGLAQLEEVRRHIKQHRSWPAPR